jgi:hypothetical protein
MSKAGNDESRRNVHETFEDHLRQGRKAGSSFERSLRFAPASLHKSLRELQKQQDKLGKFLDDESGQKLFQEDPVKALDAAGIKAPPELRKRLRQLPKLAAELNGRSFLLPTGEVITPNVRVRVRGK